MKKIALLISALLLSVVIPITVFSSKVQAVDVLTKVCSNAAQLNETPSVCLSPGASPSNPVYGVVTVVINILSAIVGLAAVITLILAGLRMVTAAGEPKSIAQARRAVLYALIGIGIAVLAQVIVGLIINKFTIKGS